MHDTILVTGCAGFIGFHTAMRLLEEDKLVIGIDNLNEYYDPELKKKRLKELQIFDDFRFFKGDLSDSAFIDKIFSENKISKVCHLGAQAGVRYSIDNPHVYARSNIEGTANILESCRKHGVKDVVLASSSSVYGNSENMPLSEDQRADKPVSLYAATKKSNEDMAFTYHHLFGLNCTCLRFFTVYGPWGRPDMALFKFTKNILEKKPIQVFNDGDMYRDFTYITDIVSGVLFAIEKPLGYEVINLARGEPVKLLDFVSEIENNLGIKAEKDLLPMQPGDVYKTFGDITKAKKLLNYEPKVSLSEGVKQFVNWYKNHYST
ncbi:MAG: GDP-mannose 4,6-dehydratase [Candidatus Woesearchaeota archaeon]